jgi:hypothetical protein
MRTTDDKSAGYFDTDAPELPVEASIHMKNQVSAEAPPIEDEKYVPASPKELGLAAQLIAEKVPADQIEKFYRAALDLLEDCVVKSKNSPENLYLEDEEELKRPIIVQKESKKRVTPRLVDYITNVRQNKNQLGEAMSARNKDFARKWKQGDTLRFADDNADHEAEFGDDVEFHPDADDLIAFMEETGEEDASNVFGATEDTAEEANQEYSLTDVLKSKVYPKAGRESAIHNKVERDMFQTLRMTDSAPQVSDRLQGLVNSGFAIDAFLDSMYHADLLSDESLAELEANPEAVKSSSLYRYFTSIAFVRPTVKELEKLAELGPDVFDFKKRRSQISPMDAKTIIKSVKDAWGRKSAKQRANIVIKATRNMGEFEDRDRSVMG